MDVDNEETECRQKLTCKFDTGTQSNVLPIETYQLLHPYSTCDQYDIPQDIKKSSTRITTVYDYNQVTTYGVCTLTTQVDGVIHSILFHIVKASSPVIIGYPTCRALKLITLNFTINDQQIPTPLQVSRLADQSCKPIGNDVANVDVLRKYKECF